MFFLKKARALIRTYSVKMNSYGFVFSDVKRNNFLQPGIFGKFYLLLAHKKITLFWCDAFKVELDMGLNAKFTPPYSTAVLRICS